MGIGSRLVVVMGVLLAAQSAAAGGVAVALASNLSALAPALGAAFEAETGQQVRFSVGSSGKLLTQILHGGPYDVFVSADRARPARVVAAGLGGRTVTYAQGRLVVMGRLSTSQNLNPRRLVRQTAFCDPQIPQYSAVLENSFPASQLRLEVLRGTQLVVRGDTLRRVLLREILERGGRFAMANPRTAPYGLAAQEVLQSLLLWDAVAAQAVIGESVGQAAQFVRSGAVSLGFVARAQVPVGVDFIEVPADLHRPLAQDAVLLSTDNPAARAFVDFLVSPTARGIFKAAGYEVAQ